MPIPMFRPKVAADVPAEPAALRLVREEERAAPDGPQPEVMWIDPVGHVITTPPPVRERVFVP